MNTCRITVVLLCVLLLDGCGLIRKTAGSSAGTTQQIPWYENTDKSAVSVSETPKATVKIDADKLKTSREVKQEDISDDVRDIQRRLLKIAKSKLGCRYQSGGKGPNSFDCSGFTGYVFKQLGISLGASSRDQFLQGRVLKDGDELRTGDLVFWNGRRVGNTVGHVGMVVDYDKKTGTFTFIHSSCSCGVEIQKSSAEYYAKRYMGARRILDDPKTVASVIPEPETVTQSVAPEPPEDDAVYHTIKSGDTLSAIALKYHTSVSNICTLNGITTKTILKIGRQLRIR